MDDILPGGRPLTREKVRARARALASLDGRSPIEVSQVDYEQAKRELTGKAGLAQQEAMLDLLPETSLVSAPQFWTDAGYKCDATPTASTNKTL